MNWTIKKIQVSELKEYEKNPRKLTEKGLRDLKASIEKFGIAEPLVVNTNMVICGGHGRKKVLEEMGIVEVDCYMPERELTEEEFKELNVRLNKNVAGEFDWDILKTEFGLDFLKDVGFEDWEFKVNMPDFNKPEDLPDIDIEGETDDSIKNDYLILSFEDEDKHIVAKIREDLGLSKVSRVVEYKKVKDKWNI